MTSGLATGQMFATSLAIVGRLAVTDLSLANGELVALVGPNGGGKTSLLRAIAGVEGSSGRIEVDGEVVGDAAAARRAQLIGLVPASRELRWPIAVSDLVRLGRARVDEARVAALLDRLELAPLAHRPVDRLSTGERARVVVARLLVARPRLMLLDEPLANLDPYWVLRMIELLRDEASAGAAVVVALHDLDQLAKFDRALMVAGGEIIADQAPADLLASPRFADIFRVKPTAHGFSLV